MQKVDEMYEKYSHFKNYKIKVAADEPLNDMIDNFIVRQRSRGVPATRINAVLVDTLQRYIRINSKEVKQTFEISFFRKANTTVSEEAIKFYLEVCNLCDW